MTKQERWTIGFLFGCLIFALGMLSGKLLAAEPENPLQQCESLRDQWQVRHQLTTATLTQRESDVAQLMVANQNLAAQVKELQAKLDNKVAKVITPGKN